MFLPLSIRSVLKAKHKIVSVADDNYVPLATDDSESELSRRPVPAKAAKILSISWAESEQ